MIAIIFFGSMTLLSQKGEFGLRYVPVFTKFDINTSAGGKLVGDVILGYGLGAITGF